MAKSLLVPGVNSLVRHHRGPVCLLGPGIQPKPMARPLISPRVRAMGPTLPWRLLSVQVTLINLP